METALKSNRARDYLCCSLLLPALWMQLSCSTNAPEAEAGEIGRWERADSESGSVEFTSQGGFTATDNVGGTVAGTYVLDSEGNLTMRITRSDIMRPRLESVELEILKAVARIDGDELHLSILGDTEVYRRVARDQSPDG